MQSEWAAELSGALPPDRSSNSSPASATSDSYASVLTGRPLVQVEADGVASGFAADNAVRGGIADRVEVRLSRVEDALGEDERFALIVADPPYLRSVDVGRFPDDPMTAIDGGRDGLDLVRSTLDILSAHMAPDGVCLLQLAGPAQVQAVDRLVRDGWPALAVTASRSVDLERAVALVVRS